MVGERTVQMADDQAMGVIRDILDLEHSSGQLVAGPFLSLGVEELLEGHRAAMVGRSDAEGRGGGRHARLILSIERPEGFAGLDSTALAATRRDPP